MQRQAIVRMVESGPIPAIHGVVRWRLIDLAQWIYEEFRITVAKQTLSRELRAMGYRKLSARPRHHAQAEGAIEDFKKASQRAWIKSRAKSNRRRQDRNLVPGRGSYRPEEQDHPQVGQARHSPERASGSANRIDLYLRCDLPETGQGRGSDPALLQYRSDEPAPRGNRQGGRTRSPRRPPRRSGRMASVSKIAHSANITILALPSKCPELNPVENIWQYMRDNWLSNRIFKSYDDIVDHCCYAWNTLVDRL